MKRDVLLWIVQALLAALFMFAGVMKLIMPAAQLTSQSTLSVTFLRFIGVVEFLGAIGLIVPWLTRIAPRLTPIAAAGLVIIMIGAVVISASGGVKAAAIPAVTGILCAFVAWSRWKDARSRASSHNPQVAESA